MYLVTGGCGFIGSHLVRSLIPRGKRILIVDSIQYGDPTNLGTAGNEAVEIIKFNLGFDDPSVLRQRLKGVTHVYHLAAEKHNQSKNRPDDVFQANVFGMHQLFEILANEGVKKIVFTSSLYAYGRMHGPPTVESDDVRPATTYGLSKVCGEEIVSYMTRRYGIAANTLRLYFIYGPRQYAGMGYKSLIVKSFERILQAQPPVVYGDGLQSLDYVYVDDAVDATIAAMDSDVSGETFNISSGVASSVNTVVETMLKVAGSQAKAMHGEADWTAGSCRVGNSEKARNLLGWFPKVSLEEGLACTFEWVKEQHCK